MIGPSPQNGLEETLKHSLQALQNTHRLRTLTPLSPQQGIFVQDQDGKSYINFVSNDYLGLSQKQFSPVQDALRSGSGGSRLLGGDTPAVHQLEKAIADSLGYPSAVFFNSGYHMNVGTVSCLYGPQDVIFCDKLAHASLMDGLQLSKATFYRFRHNDMAHLEALLLKHRSKYRHALIISESVFSMDGDFSHINDLIILKRVYDSHLMIDDAHGIGVLGKNGYGIAENTKEIDILAGTFGKALGSMGGYIATSKIIADYLVNTCRSFIYSTALPGSVINRNLVAWMALPYLKKERETVLKLSTLLREKLSQNWSCLGESHIVPIMSGPIDKTMTLEDHLKKSGIWVSAIRPPTVPEHKCRLRFSITALHTAEHIEKVSYELNRLV